MSRIETDIQNGGVSPISLYYYEQAKRGVASAQNELGVNYKYGEDGLPEDAKEAMFWYSKAARKGHILAIYNIGLQYEEGHGVPQSYRKAYRWYNRAAKLGDPVAFSTLGKLYANGHYVEQDFEKARTLHLKALDSGDPEAYNDAAWFLATVDDENFLDAELALRAMKESIQSTPSDHNLFDTLAACYASLGQFEEAIKAVDQAIEMAKAEGDDESTLSYQEHKHSYQNQKRWIFYKKQ